MTQVQPKRIQRKRTKGWKMPPNAIYVGRPTKWGNPFVVRECCVLNTINGHTVGDVKETPEDAMASAVYLYKRRVIENAIGGIEPKIRAALEELRGKDLVCWCPLDQACHADVLLEFANRSYRSVQDAAEVEAS